MQVDSRRMEVGGCWMRLGYDRLSNSDAGSKVADSIIDVAGAVSADFGPLRHLSFTLPRAALLPSCRS